MGQTPHPIPPGIQRKPFAGLFNGSLMVKGGVGYALCLDKIIHTSDDSELCFRPLFPKVEHGMHIIWKKYQVHSKATQRFLQKLQEAKTAF